MCLLLCHGMAEASAVDPDGFRSDDPVGTSDAVVQERPLSQLEPRTTAPGRQQAAPAVARPAPAAQPGQPQRVPAQTTPPSPAAAQPRAPGTSQPATPPPTTPSTPSAESLRAELDRSISEEMSSSTFSNQAGDLGSLSAISSGGMPQMIGDLGPLPSLNSVRLAAGSRGLPPPFPPPRPPGVPRPRGASVVVPSIRNIKVSEDQSPRPQDRVYGMFNYFQGVNDQVNQRLRAPIGYSQVYRYIGGFEKTFLDGDASIGFRQPIDVFSTNSALPKRFGNFGGTSTAVGDLEIILKYILLEDRQSGSLLSGGLDVTAPTGPGRFAGFNGFASPVHTTGFQPFLGYIVNSGNIYLHGFSILDVPANSQNVTLFYNDIGVGYFLRRPDPQSNVDQMISLIAPTFEVHINTPLNHRNPFNAFDLSATPDYVDLTYGINIGIYSRTLLTFAVCTPISSPKPFDFETMMFLNIFFGRSVRNPVQTPPVIGG
jgi:hypothetical protein